MQTLSGSVVVKNELKGKALNLLVNLCFHLHLWIMTERIGSQRQGAEMSLISGWLHYRPGGALSPGGGSSPSARGPS